MGEQAENMTNGDDCQQCGEYIGPGVGYPRSCQGCEPTKPKAKLKFTSIFMHEEITGLARRGFQTEQFNDYHYRINGILDVWPTKQKYHHLPTNERGVFKNYAWLIEKFLSKAVGRGEKKTQEGSVIDNMKMLETIKWGTWIITRVPGGWIFKDHNGSTQFVPFCKE